MCHNRGSIIAQYTYVIYIENDLVRLWIPAGALPVDPQSLALRFVGFTHSACHYYSQLFSTTQIGLATTLLIPFYHMFFFLFSSQISHSLFLPCRLTYQVHNKYTFSSYYPWELPHEKPDYFFVQCGMMMAHLTFAGKQVRQ